MGWEQRFKKIWGFGKNKDFLFADDLIDMQMKWDICFVLTIIQSRTSPGFIVTVTKVKPHLLLKPKMSTFGKRSHTCIGIRWGDYRPSQVTVKGRNVWTKAKGSEDPLWRSQWTFGVRKTDILMINSLKDEFAYNITIFQCFGISFCVPFTLYIILGF